MTTPSNLLGIPPTLLPDDSAARIALASDAAPTEAAAAFPAASVVWAHLADLALQQARTVEGYAYARVGYHRGLDALRRAGWRGQGPVPWSHEPNRGFLRCLAALATAAEAIGEADEATRCREFLDACDPSAATAISGQD